MLFFVMKVIFEVLFVSLYLAIYIVRPILLLMRHKMRKVRYYDNAAHGELIKQEPITIILPAHNEEEILEESIMNIMSQHLGEYEIIIGENNSSDGTLAIARRLEREHPHIIRVLELTPPANVTIISWVLNQMLAEARHDLICRIDADSVLKDPYAIAKLINPMIKDESISATGGNVKILGATNSLLLNLQSMEYMIANELNKNHLKHTSICLSGCYMGFRKSRLPNGFVEKKGISEDMTVTIELSDRTKGKTMFVKDSLVHTDGMRNFKELKKQRVWWNELGLNAFYHNRKAILNKKFGLVGVNLFIIIALSCRSFLGLILRVAESLQDTIISTLILLGTISALHLVVASFNILAARIISEDKEKISVLGMFLFAMWYCPVVGFWRFISTTQYLSRVTASAVSMRVKAIRAELRGVAKEVTDLGQQSRGL